MNLLCTSTNTHHALLPQPLRTLALGLRALPPLTHISTEALSLTDLCWAAPLWSNPLFTTSQTWDWHGQQHPAPVALEHTAPTGLLNLPQLQCLGQLVTLYHELTRVCASNSLAAHAAYNACIYPIYLQCRPQYADRQSALADVAQLTNLIPHLWVEAAEAHFTAAWTSGAHATALMTIPTTEIASARDGLSAHLGWQLPGPGNSRPTSIPLTHLTVATATRIQQSTSLTAIHQRHDAFINTIAALDPPFAPHLPHVCSVLSRWWQLRIANTYKEAAWRLTLDAFPTAQRMHLNTPCPACGALGPGSSHFFWSCPVAKAVQQEILHQLAASGIMPATANLPCSAIWLACLPSPQIHRLIWDLVCLAAVHAMDIGRRTAWAVSQRLDASQLVEHIAARAARGAFWDALADFAATLKIPRAARCQQLTNQPFIVWCVVLTSGNGLRVIRH